ncbi:MAG: hypothetical protein CMK59_09495 [Proteobacteria bacterium]|nr:hypothetical protein [Pseudomonadota bacterium]
MPRDLDERELRILHVAQEAFDALKHVERPLLVNGRSSAWEELPAWNRWKVGLSSAHRWPQETDLDAVLLRLLPEKAAMNLAIQAVAARMTKRAELWIVGTNDEGVKSWLKRLSPWFDDVETVLFKRHCRLLRAFRTSEELGLKGSLESWQEKHEILIDGNTTSWVSYPGLFAKGAVDPATSLLLETLSGEKFKRSVLDFCAGQGVISAVLKHRQPDLSIHALDSDALAQAAFEVNVPYVRFFLSDAWRSVPPQNRYSAIISNPPIHQGKAEDQRVLQELIEQSPRWLERRGVLWIVTQRRILMEKRLSSVFKYVSCVAQNNRFWVWKAQN